MTNRQEDRQSKQSEEQVIIGDTGVVTALDLFGRVAQMFAANEEMRLRMDVLKVLADTLNLVASPPNVSADFFRRSIKSVAAFRALFPTETSPRPLRNSASESEGTAAELGYRTELEREVEDILAETRRTNILYPDAPCNRGGPFITPVLGGRAGIYLVNLFPSHSSANQDRVRLCLAPVLELNAPGKPRIEYIGVEKETRTLFVQRVESNGRRTVKVYVDASLGVIKGLWLSVALVHTTSLEDYVKVAAEMVERLFGVNDVLRWMKDEVLQEMQCLCRDVLVARYGVERIIPLYEETGDEDDSEGEMRRLQYAVRYPSVLRFVDEVVDKRCRVFQTFTVGSDATGSAEDETAARNKTTVRRRFIRLRALHLNVDGAESSGWKVKWAQFVLHRANEGGFLLADMKETHFATHSMLDYAGENIHRQSILAVIWPLATTLADKSVPMEQRVWALERLVEMLEDDAGTEDALAWQVERLQDDDELLEALKRTNPLARERLDALLTHHAEKTNGDDKGEDDVVVVPHQQLP